MGRAGADGGNAGKTIGAFEGGEPASFPAHAQAGEVNAIGIGADALDGGIDDLRNGFEHLRVVPALTARRALWAQDDEGEGFLEGVVVANLHRGAVAVEG